jgi:GMP synthase (glutamine-hydrolysing)
MARGPKRAPGRLVVEPSQQCRPRHRGAAGRPADLHETLVGQEGERAHGGPAVHTGHPRIGTDPGMKPVLILQHLSPTVRRTSAPGCSARACRSTVRNTEAGQAYPDLHGRIFGAGGAGRRDERQRPAAVAAPGRRLIRQAMAAGKPVIGHCLGGQLMARALGARVGDSPAPEVGWQALDIVDSDLARAWFGQRRRATVFQWHFEAFELPPGADAAGRQCGLPAPGLCHRPAPGHAVPHRGRRRQGHCTGRASTANAGRAAQAQHPGTVQGCAGPARRAAAAPGRAPGAGRSAVHTLAGGVPRRR